MADQGLRYEALPVFTTKTEVLEAIEKADDESLAVIALAIGESFYDFEFAQRTCLQLADHEDAYVRASACLGLGYLARTHRRLDKRLVKPVILRELRSQTEFRGRVEDAISDINVFLDWSLAQKNARP